MHRLMPSFSFGKFETKFLFIQKKLNIIFIQTQNEGRSKRFSNFCYIQPL
jgi:hypothetical protein